jgi:hypothetical protein
MNSAPFEYASALLTNIRLSGKSLPGTNAPAYLNSSSNEHKNLAPGDLFEQNQNIFASKGRKETTLER